MAKPPPECVSRSVIAHSPADFPWYPASAVSCGKFAGIEYFRPGAKPPPPLPAPRPPAAIAPLQGAALGAAEREAQPLVGGPSPGAGTSGPPPAAIDPLEGSAERLAQPAGDVDADEDPDAYEPGEPPEPDDDPGAVPDDADSVGDV
jgi:hypothetical protein